MSPNYDCGMATFIARSQRCDRSRFTTRHVEERIKEVRHLAAVKGFMVAAKVCNRTADQLESQLEGGAASVPNAAYYAALMRGIKTLAERRDAEGIRAACMAALYRLYAGDGYLGHRLAAAAGVRPPTAGGGCGFGDLQRLPHDVLARILSHV